MRSTRTAISLHHNIVGNRSLNVLKKIPIHSFIHSFIQNTFIISIFDWRCN